MKEIRFRVWDKRIEKMGEVTELGFSKVRHHLVKYRYINERGKVVDEQSHFDKGFTNGLDIMQYTGLKDKNGNEIYEGDIIRTTYPDCTAVVVWEEDTVRYIGYTIESERKIIYVDMVDRNDKPAVEIIGNIYENPELL